MATDDDRRIDWEMAERFLGALFEPDDAIEFRYVNPAARDGGSCTFRRLSAVLAGDEVLHRTAENQARTRDVYVGGNPRRDLRGSGKAFCGTADDVALARCLFVDFDDAPPEEAVGRIAAAGLARPTVVVASGRPTGTHAWWRLDEPIEEADLLLWTRLQVGLSTVLGSDPKIHDAPRIMRLAGTWNHKHGRPCLLIGVGERLPSWREVGVEPAAEAPLSRAGAAGGAAPLPADAPPDWDGLNRTCRAYLDADAVPEGERNTSLFAAAIDFKANRIPIEDAIRELAEHRAIARDGLPHGEAYRTVRSAYSYEDAAPTPGTCDADATYAALGGSRAAPARPPKQALTGAEQALTGAEQALTGAPLARIGPPAKAPVDDPYEGIDDPDLPAEPPRDAAGRSLDVRDRPFVSNIHPHHTRDKAGKRQTALQYLPIPTIASNVHAALDGWPRRSGATGLFAVRMDAGQPRTWILPSAKELFALLHERANTRWEGGQCEVEHSGDTMSCPTKEEFHAWLHENVEPSYQTVAELPHWPPMPGAYYLPVSLPEPTGEALQELLDHLNPETEHDRMLLLAMFMTPGWGGPPGSRPVFILSSDHGYGAGKTLTAELFGEVWGGALPLDYEEKSWAALSKQIMSSDQWLARVILFDNVKGKFSGGSLEAAITAKQLVGHKMYVGTVRRPNDATFVCTFNVPELGPDLASRAIVIKIGPRRKYDFAAWADVFSRERRLELVSDLLALLRAEPAEIPAVAVDDRWRAWRAGVLARVPGADVVALATLMAERRPAADSDADETLDIVSTLGHYLDRRGRGRVCGEVAQITAAEIAVVLRDAGMWRPSKKVSAARDAQNCVQYIRRRLTPLGVLGERMRRVRVDDAGEPVHAEVRDASGASQAYAWHWAAAEAAAGGRWDLPTVHGGAPDEPDDGRSRPYGGGSGGPSDDDDIPI